MTLQPTTRVAAVVVHGVIIAAAKDEGSVELVCTSDDRRRPTPSVRDIFVPTDGEVVRVERDTLRILFSPRKKKRLFWHTRASHTRNSP